MFHLSFVLFDVYFDFSTIDIHRFSGETVQYPVGAPSWQTEKSSSFCWSDFVSSELVLSLFICSPGLNGKDRIEWMGCLSWMNSKIYGGEGWDGGEEGMSVYVCFSESQSVVGGLYVMKGIRFTLVFKNNKIKNLLVQPAYDYTWI